MTQLYDELQHMLQSGWKQIDEWEGIVPGKEFFCVVGGFSGNWPPSEGKFYVPSIQKFICGAILSKERGHVKFVDGQWTPIGNDRVWILRATQDGSLHGGMSGGFGMYGSIDEANAAVEEKLSQRIVNLREKAKAYLEEAAELEANKPIAEILDFTVDFGDSLV